MRTLIVTELVTIDGVIDSPGGGDHPHAGWTFKDVAFDEAAYEIKGREQKESGALLVGAQSWREFHEIWPTMEADFAHYNAMPKYVVSTTLSDAEIAESPWQPMTLLRSVEDVKVLKEAATDEEAGGPIIVHGSARLAQSLAAADLVDRYHLLVFPVLLGSGKKLFVDQAEKQQLRVVESQTYDNGVTKLVLEVKR